MLTLSKAALAPVALALVLAACSGDSAPEVTPAPETVTETVTSEPTEEATEEATETPEATEEPAEAPAATGTREAPLALGETRKVADGSAWTVGLTASNLDAAAAIRAADEYAEQPKEGERFVLATLQVTVDQAAIEAQGFAMSDGADPRGSINVSYVAADGTSYETFGGSYCFSQNDFASSAGTLYADGASTAGDFCVVVPADKVDGGLWRVSNLQNDAVWISGV